MTESEVRAAAQAWAAEQQLGPQWSAVIAEGDATALDRGHSWYLTDGPRQIRARAFEEDGTWDIIFEGSIHVGRYAERHNPAPPATPVRAARVTQAWAMVDAHADAITEDEADAAWDAAIAAQAGPFWTPLRTAALARALGCPAEALCAEDFDAWEAHPSASAPDAD